jgi:CubicO group peptidase (beta-lactamase class C family)
MKQSIAFLLVLCFLMVLSAGNKMNAQSGETDAVNAAVDQIFKKARTVGASLVIMKDGAVLYRRDYGMRNLHQKLPVDENTYFRVSSVTKMVSAIAILQQVEAGLLGLDEDISEYFGYQIANPYFRRIPLTLRQLMSHTSSVSEGGGFSSIRSTVNQMLSRKSNRKSNYLDAAPGSRYVYSNFGAGLAGSCVEAVTGKSFNRTLTDGVFKPLGIDASLAASWLLSPDDIASVYENGTLKRAAAKYLNETYEDTASPETHYRTSVGGLFIRAKDLALLASALCGDGQANGVRLLKEETVRMMREQQHTLGESVSGESPYGLFLERNTRLLPGHTVFGHQGMSNGASSNVYFEPESGFVFVLTTNGCSQVRDHGTIVLAQNLLRYTYPLFSGSVL